LVVSNSTPLVYLAALGDFDFLRVLFDEITIPCAVYEEVAIAGARFPAGRAVLEAHEKWINVREIGNPSVSVALQNGGLHAGESEAIALAAQIQPFALLMDDQDAVERAAHLGLNVIRTPGVYRMAKQKGLVSAVRPKLDELRTAGFWLREEHYNIILRSAGEM
jgi:predicted nucleic acid-binding protein